MKRHTALTLLACTPSVTAQSFIGTGTHQLSFQEIDAHTHVPVLMPNGIVEPGEAAMVSLSVSFSPPVGAIVQVNPPAWIPVTIRSLGRTWFHLEATSGSWSNIQLAQGWNQSGNPTANGSIDGSLIHHVYAFQSAPGAITTNPVENIWQGIWRPTTYTDRLEGFWTRAVGISGRLDVDLWVEEPDQSYSLAPLQASEAEMVIPISSVPAPGSGAVVLGAIGAIRSRRRRCS